MCLLPDIRMNTVLSDIAVKRLAYATGYGHGNVLFLNANNKMLFT